VCLVISSIGKAAHVGLKEVLSFAFGSRVSLPATLSTWQKAPRKQTEIVAARRNGACVPILLQKSSSSLLQIRRTATDRIPVLISLLGGIAFLRRRRKKSHFRCILSICASEVQLGLLQHNLPLAVLSRRSINSHGWSNTRCQGSSRAQDRASPMRRARADVTYAQETVLGNRSLG
jgi:hypothetical protein